MARHPFFPKIFLSAGDWSTRLWNEDLKTPVIVSRFMTSHLTGCRWSPSRRAAGSSTWSRVLNQGSGFYPVVTAALTRRLADSATAGGTDVVHVTALG